MRSCSYFSQFQIFCFYILICCRKPHFCLDNKYTVDKEVFVLKKEKNVFPGENTQQTLSRSEARRDEKANGLLGKRDPCKYFLCYITTHTLTHTQGPCVLASHALRCYITGLPFTLLFPLLQLHRVTLSFFYSYFLIIAST